MRKFEILEHKADLKIKVFGRTKKELFLNALLAMISGLQPKIQNQKGTSSSSLTTKFWCGGSQTRAKIKNLKIKSIDLPALLVDFLSEVLYLIQTNKEIYTDIKFKKFSDTEIEANLFGNKVEGFGEDIKAVTYHNLEIQQKKDKTWEATILFDV